MIGPSRRRPSPPELPTADEFFGKPPIATSGLPRATIDQVIGRLAGTLTWLKANRASLDSYPKAIENAADALLKAVLEAEDAIVYRQAIDRAYERAGQLCHDDGRA
jgi:hypothetical protein